MRKLLLRLLRGHRLFDLLADVSVVLAQRLLLFGGEDLEGHAHEALGELDVQPVLAVLDPARDVEIQAPYARTPRAELNLIPVPHGLVQIGEEADAARLRRARRKVVDRLAHD